MEYGEYEYNLKAIGAKNCLLDWTTDYAGILLWYGRFKSTGKFCYYIIKRPRLAASGGVNAAKLLGEKNHATESKDISRDEQSE